MIDRRARPLLRLNYQQQTFAVHFVKATSSFDHVASRLEVLHSVSGNERYWSATISRVEWKLTCVSVRSAATIEAAMLLSG